MRKSELKLGWMVLRVLRRRLLRSVGSDSRGAGFFTNGVPPAGGTQYPFTFPLTGNELIPADTELANGEPPQSIAISTSQLASVSNANGGVATGTNATASATTGAATLNAGRGVVTSESLTTAAGADYTLTLTNSQILATSVMAVSVGNGSNTGGTPAVATVTPGAGTATIVVQNIHATAAFNGTIKIAFNIWN